MEMNYATKLSNGLDVYNRINADENFSEFERNLFDRISFLSLNTRSRACSAGNNYFIKAFGKTEQEIEDAIWKLYDNGYISITLHFNGKDQPTRFLRIRKSELEEN